MLWILFICRALAEAPTDLDGLVRLALERDPSALAVELDGQAAALEARAAARPMNPMLMVGGQSLGAMPGDPDPPMYMVGFEQMLQGWNEARSAANRAEVDASGAEAELALVAADLRLRLAQMIARIRAEQAELSLLDTQIQAAEFLWQAGVRRWGAGGVSAGGMAGGMGGQSMRAGMQEGPGSTPPVVERGASSGGMAMPGMGATSPNKERATMGMDPTGPMAVEAGGMGSGAPAMATGSGLSELLRVEAEAAGLQADRAGLEARLQGELAVLARFVGEEAAEAVAVAPGAYLVGLSAEERPPPEVELAATAVRAAEADLSLARARLAPDIELGGSVGIMPDGMFQGVNFMVGVEMPVFGANARTRDAALVRAEAAVRRAESVERDLGAATDAALASETAARVRAQVLRESAVPRAEAAFQAALGRYAAGLSGVEDALRAWESLLEMQRERIAAERDEALRAAERLRVEVR